MGVVLLNLATLVVSLLAANFFAMWLAKRRMRAIDREAQR